MRKAFLLLILSCIAVHAWIPMAVVPPNGNVSIGALPAIAGDAMPAAATTATIRRRLSEHRRARRTEWKYLPSNGHQRFYMPL